MPRTNSRKSLCSEGYNYSMTSADFSMASCEDAVVLTINMLEEVGTTTMGIRRGWHRRRCAEE